MKDCESLVSEQRPSIPSAPDALLYYTPLHAFFPSLMLLLILLRGRLTRLQLIQIPPTNRQIALVLIHARLEAADLALADLGRLVGLVHRVLAVLRLGDGLVGRGLRSGGAAAEPAADGVPDGGSDCDAAGEGVSGLVRVCCVR